MINPKQSPRGSQCCVYIYVCVQFQHSIQLNSSKFIKSQGRFNENMYRSSCPDARNNIEAMRCRCQRNALIPHVFCYIKIFISTERSFFPVQQTFDIFDFNQINVRVRITICHMIKRGVLFDI